MLRVLGGRCLRAASGSNEPYVVAFCCVPNLTSSKEVLKNSHLSILRCFASTTRGNRRNEDVIIYKGRLEKDIFRVKVFSMTTSLLGLACQPLLYSQASSLPVLVASCTVAGFFTFVTPVLLNQLAKRHVNTVTYNSEKDYYVAHTTTFFFKEKKILIEPGEAKVPESGGMFTSLEVRGIPLMVEMDAFDKHHLIRLLGYDKPLDIDHERLANLMKEADERASSQSTTKKESVKEDIVLEDKRQKRSGQV